MNVFCVLFFVTLCGYFNKIINKYKAFSVFWPSASRIFGFDPEFSFRCIPNAWCIFILNMLCKDFCCWLICGLFAGPSMRNWQMLLLRSKQYFIIREWKRFHLTSDTVHITLVRNWECLWLRWAARPDFAELDVSLGQHILLTLEQHFNSKM